MQQTQRINPVGRPPASNSAETRKRIIDAARDVFRTVGYAGATHLAIAARAALTRPAINYHFASKQALFDVVVQTDVDTLAAELGAAAGEPTLAGRLRVFATAMCGGSEVHSAVVFLATAAMERQRHPELQKGDGIDAAAGLREFLTTSVASAVVHHEVRADIDVMSVADTLYAVLTGMALFGDAVPAVNYARVDTLMRLLTGDLFTGVNVETGASTRVA